MCNALDDMPWYSAKETVWSVKPMLMARQERYLDTAPYCGREKRFPRWFHRPETRSSTLRPASKTSSPLSSVAQSGSLLKSRSSMIPHSLEKSFSFSRENKICYNIANKRRGKKDSLEYREQSCDPAAKVDILVNCQHPKA